MILFRDWEPVGKLGRGARLGDEIAYITHEIRRSCHGFAFDSSFSLFMQINVPSTLASTLYRWRDGEMERWRDGEMERWRDADRDSILFGWDRP